MNNCPLFLLSLLLQARRSVSASCKTCQTDGWEQRGRRRESVNAGTVNASESMGG